MFPWSQFPSVAQSAHNLSLANLPWDPGFYSKINPSIPHPLWPTLSLDSLLHDPWKILTRSLQQKEFLPKSLSQTQSLVGPTLCNPMDCSMPWTVAPLSPTISRGCSNSCLLSQWCYLTISSSSTLSSFCLQSFLASGSFPMSLLFTSGGQSIGASASILPMNIQDLFPLGLTGLISLQSKGLYAALETGK